MSTAQRKYVVLNVTVGTSFAGTTLFTVPEEACDVTLSPPEALVEEVLSIKPLSLGGQDFDPAITPYSGKGMWSMRRSGGATGQAIAYDAKVANTGGAYTLEYWV